MAHLTEGEVEAFAAGRLGAEARDRAVSHLLGGCLACAQRLLSSTPLLFLEDATADGEISDVYDAAIDRAFASLERAEKPLQEAKDKLPEALILLRQAKVGARSLTYQQRKRLQGWPLVTALLQLSFEARYRNPRRMLWLAIEAQYVAESLEPEAYRPGFVTDIRARVWAELANAYRVNEQYDDADAALRQAYKLSDDGSGDSCFLARLLDVEASLRRDQRRLSDALDLLARARDLYLEAGERHLAGRALINRGIALYTARDPFEAVRSLEQGIELLDRERDPQLVAVALQDLVTYLTDCGEFRKAGEVLLESGLRQAFAMEPLVLLRLRWVEGQIHAGLGRLSRAEKIFREVRRDFQERDLDYDAALVGLDLAAVCLRQGKSERVRPLALEMFETFRALDIHPEAIKALRFLKVACEERLASVRIIEGIRKFLAQLQNEPRLRFEPASVL